MSKRKGNQAKAIRVSEATHSTLLKLSLLERRNVQDVAERLLAPVAKAALEAAKANPPV